jgi:predicted ABC-type ATPase
MARGNRHSRRRGFQFNLAYVSVFPPELSPARVSERVIKGGHAVAWDKAIARYHRSHQELVWFAEQADVFMIFDNSADDGVPVLIASRNGRLEAAGVMAERYRKCGVNPTVDEALRKVPGFDDQD